MEKKIKTEDEEIKAAIKNIDEVWDKYNIQGIKANSTTVLSINTSSYQYVDPVAEKLKELEKRIDAWQNKFEFVNVKEN